MNELLKEKIENFLVKSMDSDFNSKIVVLCSKNRNVEERDS